MGGSAASAVVPRPCQAIESFLRSFSLSVEGFIADQLGPNIRSSPSGPHPLMLLAGEMPLPVQGAPLPPSPALAVELPDVLKEEREGGLGEHGVGGECEGDGTEERV